MRMPELMEALIAVGSVITVVGAIGSILWRITRGDGSGKKLDAIKHQLLEESGARQAPAPDKNKA